MVNFRHEGIPSRTISEEKQFMCTDNTTIITAVEVYNNYTVANKVGWIRVSGGAIGTHSMQITVTSVPGFGYAFDIHFCGYSMLLPVHRSDNW